MITVPEYAHAPEAIQALFRTESVMEVQIGCSSSRVFRVEHGEQTVYLKTHHLSPHFSFAHEAQVLRWLSGRLPVPSVLDYTVGSTHEYLVLSEIAGENCVDAMTHLAPAEIVALLARGLRQIHALNIAACPFDERIAAKLAHAWDNIEHGLVDETDFDTERLGMTAAAVYETLRLTIPSEDDLILAHGDYCLPNVLIRNDIVSGFIDLDRAGISDRYNDLAIASRSIGHNLGADYERLFFEQYGLDMIDHDKIRYYRMLDELF